MIKFVLLILVIISACTVGGEVTNKNEIVHCTDFRDGEKFSFKSSDIFNVRIGILADSCYDVVDSKCNKRTLCESQEKYIKCKSSSLENI